MGTLEKVGTGVGLLVIVFGAGAAWNSIDARFVRMGDKIAEIEKDHNEGPCVPILNRQIVAIEKNSETVQSRLDSLAEEYGCTGVTVVTGMRPTPAFDFDPASYEKPHSEAEKYKELVRELGEIDDQLNAASNEPREAVGD